MGAGTRGDASRAGPRGRRRWPIVLVLLVLVAGTLVWWLSPRTIVAASMTVGASVAVGEPLYVGLNDVRADVSLVASRARSTDGVQARLLVCRPRGGGERLGVVSEDIGQFCSALLPADFGARITAEGGGAPGDYLLLRLVPTVEEPQAHCGITLLYRAGWRVGVYRSDAAQVVLNADTDAAPALCA